MSETTMQTGQSPMAEEDWVDFDDQFKKWHMIFLLGLLLFLPFLQTGALAWYIIDKDLEYTILDAVYEGSDLLRKPARWYLTSTDRIYRDGKPSPDLLSFTLSQYGRRGADRTTILALAEFFLQRGADIDAYNYKGNTVLHEAVLLQQADLVRFLLRHGADPTQKTKHAQKTEHTPPQHVRTDCLSAPELARWLQTNSKARGDWKSVIEVLT